ncbi:putative Acyl CoA binding protein [Penicillium brasilianum]|uniref:Putative Acyl CoA binding protein n=1 Tax=Penicillium brasilianum TaxID=104259 RepID=A0A1S9RAM5_PENBI|nr:putative Acyl CoA binding protein [Penicillium brasilianum]
MHHYASQTPEARELVSELEFVWDQIKYNASSSSSSGPLNAVGVPPLSHHQSSAYGSIGGRLAQSPTDQYERPDMRTDDARDSRLRVLSPVSQPEEEEYYRRRRRSANGIAEDEMGDDDEDEDEEYEEARDSLYEPPDNASTNTDTHTHTGTDRTGSQSDDRRARSRSHNQAHTRHKSTSGVSDGTSINGPDSQDPSNPRDSRWRRRVEQALTKMTAEIAAVREQMEARTSAHRRRSGVWAWLKWMLWAVVRQIIWDVALLGVLLIWMRMRGDRRLETKLKEGWSGVKARLGRVKLLQRVPVMP